MSLLLALVGGGAISSSAAGKLGAKADVTSAKTGLAQSVASLGTKTAFA